MLESMTGFAEDSAHHENVLITVSLKSVNSRNLRISTSCNKQCMALEDKAYRIIREYFSRGSVSIMIHIDSDPLSQSSIQTLADKIKELPEELNPVSVEAGSLLRALRHVEDKYDLPEESVASISSIIETTAEKLRQCRREEGEKLSEEFIPRALSIKEFAEKLKEKQPEIHKALQKELEQSLNDLLEMTGSRVDKDDLARELAIRLDKVDIREEIDRLLVHIDSFIETVQSSDTVVGKKLDFLCQELHREINTLGVKVKDTSIILETVTIKTEIEKIREQVQNVQ